MTTLKSNLKKEVTSATKSRIERETFKKRMELIASFAKQKSQGAIGAVLDKNI